MPTDPAEVDAKFAEVVEELDLPPAQRQQMFALPLEKKWQLYCSRKKEEAEPNSSKRPEYYVERITTLTKSPIFALPDADARDSPRDHPLDHLIETLKTALRTQPNSFVT